MIGAVTLRQMREKGLRPPGFVVVTESKAIAKNARERGLFPLVFDPDKPDDWRLIHGLWVGLITYLPREKVAPIAQGILGAEPWQFGITYFGKYAVEHERIVSAARQG